ncbi:unnamed protein product [Closterium sp. Yama58-4]|nr:unnamed protein product [Closterium sp. Yama58-4]
MLWAYRSPAVFATFPLILSRFPRLPPHNPHTHLHPLGRAQGILFVWPDSASAEEAERTAIFEPEGVDWSAFDVALYARRLPYSYEMR